jgi:hypothetical protein
MTRTINEAKNCFLFFGGVSWMQFYARPGQTQRLEKRREESRMRWDENWMGMDGVDECGMIVKSTWSKLGTDEDE